VLLEVLPLEVPSNVSTSRIVAIFWERLHFIYLIRSEARPPGAAVHRLRDIVGIAYVGKPPSLPIRREGDTDRQRFRAKRLRSWPHEKKKPINTGLLSGWLKPKVLERTHASVG
jgi:hypothetical protein